MTLYLESLKPVDFDVSIEKWRENARNIRTQMEERIVECKALRDHGRRIRYETGIQKSWDLYYNNVKLQDRAYEIDVLIKYAQEALPLIATEKKLISEEKFLTETLLTNCDHWIEICVTGMNILDQKLEGEITRNDEVVEETKKEVRFLEESKIILKEDCLAAWEMSNRLEDIETKIGLNLEFKEEVLATDKRCQAINKMDTGVSYKVDPLKGPKKMLSIEEWSKAVYGLVEKGQNEIRESTKLRERMSANRGVTLNDYSIQFDKTDYAFRKRIYEINKEKNEVQYQLKRVSELMTATQGEQYRLELFLKDVEDDLKCAETRCSFRFFRPSVDATMDPPFIGINQEVENLRRKVEEIKNHIDALKEFHTKMDKEYYRLEQEEKAKNKSLQFQIQSLDIRIAARYDPKKVYGYNTDILTSKMKQQLPEEIVLFSNKSK